MTAKQFTKGDYNLEHCEIWLADEYIGDVRTRDADIFIEMLNTLTNENERLKEFIKEIVRKEFQNL